MSDQYTPTTEVVKDAACFPRERLGEPRPIPRAAFERWLNKIKAEAWQGGYDAGVEYGIDLESYNARGIGPFDTIEPTNPYREQETP